MEIDPETLAEASVDKMGQFKKIRLLEDSEEKNSNLEDLMYYVKTVDKKKQIVDESVKHQILSKHTAFICVGKELVDGKLQEIK